MMCSCCCRASVVSEQQHNQDLKRVYRREYEFITFYQNALHHEQHEDVMRSFRMDSSEIV